MYSFKKEYLEEIKKNNLTHMAKDIGITYVYLSYIINNKTECKKTVAFCITKYLNKNAEIEKYFTKI